MSSQEVLGSHIKFNYKGHNFIFTKEFVGTYNLPTKTEKKAQKYYLFVNALLSANLKADKRQLYFLCNKKQYTGPEDFIKLETKNNKFNNLLDIYYQADEATVLKRFNPLVLDRFTHVDLKNLNELYANAKGIFTHNILKDVATGVTKINSIGPVELTKCDWLATLDASIKRFEKNLLNIQEKISYIKPFFAK